MYGKSKLAGENAVRDLCKRFLICRVSWLAGAGGNNFVETMLRLGRERERVDVVNDQTGSPTFCEDVVPVVSRLVEGREYGVFHVAGNGNCTWFDLAREAFRLAGINVEVRPIRTEQLGRPAPRPRYAVLRNLMLALTCGDPMPPWELGLERYMGSRTG